LICINGAAAHAGAGGALDAFPVYPAGVLRKLWKGCFRNSGSLS
jgi:hypothetical protein